MYANKANITLILPFQLNQVKTYEKVKKLKKAMLTYSNELQKYLKELFLVLIQSQTSLSVYTAHALTRIKWHISNPSVTNLIFNYNPKVVYLQRLDGVKITKTKRSIISRLGTFKILTNDIPTIAVNCSFI